MSNYKQIDELYEGLWLVPYPRRCSREARLDGALRNMEGVPMYDREIETRWF